MSRRSRDSTLILREWEVWHTYSTFFTGPVFDLTRGARKLVATGSVLCAVHRDGTADWAAPDGTLQTGEVKVRLNGRGNAATIEIAPSPKDAEGAFALEALLWAANLRFEELHLLGDYSWMPNYVRLFLGECIFSGADGVFSCYPVIKIYETGVVILSFRVIGPPRGVRVDEFIHRYVNLHASRFNLLQVPPGLARLISRAETRIGVAPRSMIGRFRLIRTNRGLDRAFDQTSYTLNTGDFTFRLTAIDRGHEENSWDTLATIALAIINAVGYGMSTQRSDLLTVVKGFRPAVTRGNFWTGRPHVHIVRHADQAETAQENESRHRADFGWIMGRLWSTKDHHQGSTHLPPNQRQHGDYATYVNSAMSLWVWARKGIKLQARWADPNRSHLIYGSQTIVEQIEYAAILHRRMLQLSCEYTIPDQVLAAKRELVLLETTLRESSHFGEIRDLLACGMETLGVPALRGATERLLEVQESETALRENRVAERRNRLITFAFGLTAVPTIASEVIRPLWQYLGWWRPATASAFKILTVGISVAAVVALIQAADRWLRRTKG